MTRHTDMWENSTQSDSQTELSALNLHSCLQVA